MKYQIWPFAPQAEEDVAAGEPEQKAQVAADLGEELREWIGPVGCDDLGGGKEGWGCFVDPADQHIMQVESLIFEDFDEGLVCQVI